MAQAIILEEGEGVIEVEGGGDTFGIDVEGDEGSDDASGEAAEDSTEAHDIDHFEYFVEV